MNQTIKPGKLINDRYLIQLTLGQGRFSRTYLADDTHRFHEPCIIKEFAPQIQDAAVRQATAELFQRQAEILYRIYHPQIANFREFFRLQQGEQSRLFLVQDYVEGETYQDLLTLQRSKGKAFSATEVTDLLLNLLPVIQYLHEEGIVHRDICPENIVYRELDTLPVLIDFGSVKPIITEENAGTTGQPTTGWILNQFGKMSYTLPELGTETISPNRDFYSLGITAVSLLTGKDFTQIGTGEADWTKILKSLSLPPSLNHVLSKLLLAKPKERFTSADEILQALTTAPQSPIEKVPTSTTIVQTDKDAIAASKYSDPKSSELKAENSGKEAITTNSEAKKLFLRGCLKKLLLLLVLVVCSGTMGWFAGKLWLSFMLQKMTGSLTNPPELNISPGSANTSSSSPSDTTIPTANSSGLTNDLDIKNAIRTRRLKLGIDRQFFSDLVNERRLETGQGGTPVSPSSITNSPVVSPDNISPNPVNSATSSVSSGNDSEQDKRQWNQVAQELLDKLEKLSPEALKGLGKYTADDNNKWKSRVNQLHLGSHTLDDLINARFLNYFPDQDNQFYQDKPLGQVRSAIAVDTLQSLESGKNYELLNMTPEQTSVQMSGVLEPGDGKAYALSIPKTQFMEAKLEAPTDALLSIYSPTGKETILENSRLHQWSGLLNETGYYEFVVTSKDKKAFNYQLNIRVW